MAELHTQEREDLPITSSNYNTIDEALAQAKHDFKTGQRLVVKVLSDEGVELDSSEWMSDN